MAKIIEVIPSDDWLLTIHLDDNSTITLDLKKKLHTARFSLLRNREAFNAAKTDGNAVHWPDGLSLDIGEILELAGK